MSSRLRQSQKQSQLPRTIAISTAVVVTGVAICLTIVFSSPDDDRRSSRAAGGGDNARRSSSADLNSSDEAGRRKESTRPTNATSSRNFDIVPDDGRLLWAPPATGPPISLKYLPDGVQFVLSARPKAIMKTAVGDALFTAMGPRFEDLRGQWERTSGVALDQVDQFLMGLVSSDAEMPRAVFVVTVAESFQPPQLWGSPVEVENKESSRYYQANGWSFHLPGNGLPGNGRIFVMGSPKDIDAIRQSDRNRPLMRKELRSLAASTNDRMHVTAIIAPSFLAGDGKKMFTPPWLKFVDNVEWFLDDTVQAGMISCHFGDSFFVETQLYGSLGTPPARLTHQLRERIERLPRDIEQHMSEIDLSHWQPLAIKFPMIVRMLQKHTRVGVEAEHAVVNFVLPAIAAPHLILASELAITSPYRSLANAPQTRAPSIQSIDQLLALRISLEIPQQSLEFCLRDLVAIIRESQPDLAFDFDIRIVGTELQKEGITRNQQITDLVMVDKTVAEILTALVMRANPETSVLSPAAEEQKLVWAVDPGSKQENEQTILITTRSAIEASGRMLAEPFRP